MDAMTGGGASAPGAHMTWGVFPTRERAEQAKASSGYPPERMSVLERNGLWVLVLHYDRHQAHGRRPPVAVNNGQVKE